MQPNGIILKKKKMANNCKYMIKKQIIFYDNFILIELITIAFNNIMFKYYISLKN